MPDEQLARIENKIEAFGTRFDSIESKFEKIDSTFVDVHSRFDQLEAKMLALHESTRDEVKLVAEGQLAHREETARGFEAVRKELADSIAPLSDAVTHHSKVLKEMRRGRPDV